MAKGLEELRANRLEPALASLRKSREMDPKVAARWLMELKVLRLLKRDTDAKAVAKAFVDAHPNMESLPMIRKLITSVMKLP